MQGLMESGRRADIIAVQEPYIGKITSKKKTTGAVELGGSEITVGSNNWDIIYQPRTEKGRSRVMWMIRRNKGIKYAVRNDIWSDPDASIIDVMDPKGRVGIRIINIYNQAHSNREGWCLNRMPEGVFEQQGTILLGDFNAKGSLWDSLSDPIREESIMEIVERENLALLNEPDRVTWQRGSQKSVLDLAWANNGIETFTKWEILEEDTGSDHALIKITVTSNSTQDTYNPLDSPYNYRKADWEAGLEGAAEKLRATEEEWKRARDNEDVDDMANILEEIIKAGVERGVPKADRTWRSKKWFDEEVKEKRQAVARERRWSTIREVETEWTKAKRARWKVQRNQYFSLIRRKKKECWDKYVGSSKGNDLWGVWRLLGKRRCAKTPTIVHNEHTAVTFKDKEQTFLECLFPRAPEDTDPEVPPIPEKTREIEITKDTARTAICKQGSYKAPGPDGICFIALKELWFSIGDRVRETYQLAINQGYHSIRWRSAIGAIIPKPGKADYSKAKAHRPISLLNALGKGLERICTDMLAEVGEKGGLSEHQWGGRKARSAEECVGNTLDWAETKKEEGKKVVLVAMDIAQAFPNVSKARLSNTVFQQSGNHKLAHWVNSFMSDRKVTLRFDGETGEEHNVETGIPQGSPASPILFNLYIAPLIKEINEEIENEFEGEAITPTYIDDFTLAVAGKDWDQAITRAEYLVDKAYQWAERTHVRFEEEKMEWIRIGRKKEEEETIVLPGGKEVKESKEIKWLGVWIDCGLTFRNHVKEKVARASRAAQSIIRLGRGNKGMGVNNARKMYIACSRQVAEYGGKVWWKGQKTLSRTIDKANIQAMRRIGGHFKTAPTAAVEVENDMIPTEHRFNDKERLLAIKALQRAPNHPTNRAVRREIDNLIEEANTWSAGRRRKKGRKRGMPGAVGNLVTIVGKDWNKIERWKALHKKEKEWEREAREEMVVEIREYDKEGEEKERQEQRSEGADEIIMYSDGSKKKEGTAAGVCRLSDEGETIRSIGFRLGKKMEIMDAEMVGIKKAIEIGMKDAARERKSIITVRCDSQEAMRRVIKRQGTSGEMMAHKIRWLYDAAKTQKITVRLEWVKAHVNIKGNTIADEAANAAVGTGPLDKDAFISFAHLERESREITVKDWGEDWKMRRNKDNAIHEPAQRHQIRFEATDRKDRVIISRLRTGHIAINQYLHRFKKKDTAECECGGGEQSVTHILTACRATVEARGKDEDHTTVQSLLWTKTGIESALEIWKEFTKWRHGNGERDEEKDEEEREATRGWGGLKDREEGEAA